MIPPPPATPSTREARNTPRTTITIIRGVSAIGKSIACMFSVPPLFAGLYFHAAFIGKQYNTAQKKGKERHVVFFAAFYKILPKFYCPCTLHMV